MKQSIIGISLYVLLSITATGCTIHTTEPLPEPAAVIIVPSSTQKETTKQEETKKTEPMPPHGGVGRPVP